MTEKHSRPQYNNPRIKEAVFDFQIRGGVPFNQALCNKFLDINKNYQAGGKVQNINIDTNTNKQKIDVIGHRYISSDKKQIAVLKKHGFSFSRLAVYDGWDKNYKQALSLWENYCEIMKPTAITRVATRFISQFLIPQVFKHPKEYFNTYLQYNENISLSWEQMSFRTVFSHKNRIKSLFVFDSQVRPENQGVHVTLDIDVFADNLTLQYNSTSEIDGWFNQLRKIKNDIFEKSITDKIKELMK